MRQNVCEQKNAWTDSVEKHVVAKNCQIMNQKIHVHNFQMKIWAKI